MRRTLLIALGMGLLACSEPPRKQAELNETIPNFPLPPDAAFISREGGEDALKFRLRTPMAPEALADYYRGIFSRAPWTLVSDSPSPDGAVTLYAEQKGPSIWVTIRKADGATGSVVDIAGAKSK